MDTKFNERENLQLITEMIVQARGNVKSQSGKYSLLWGYIITLASLVHFGALMHAVETANYYAGIIWLTAPLIGIAIMVVFILQDKKKEIVRTYTDSITNSLWTGFMCSIFLTMFLLGGKQGALIYPVITLLLTFTLFVNSRAYRWKWMYPYVAVCLACVIVFRFIPTLYYPLPMATAMITGTIIPGHIMQHKSKQHV